ncbi:CIC11C00000005376 [Sungouiella intermedia]|uniref:CIC11C00000005376 n=1 Tax=Sungouiella intermedia TaxID=45354 RepID=A0A1L0DQT8_9ASCO|nr:CIC11C00000005376 [[Candida] intermedia]
MVDLRSPLQPQFSSHDDEKPLDKEYQLDLDKVSQEDRELPIRTKGVARIEMVRDYMGKKYLWLFACSIFLTCWMVALDGTTTYNYEPYATSSFDRHSMLSTLTVATSVIGAVCKPFVAKMSDLTSRPFVYVVVLVLYVLGFIIVACSPSISAFVIGSVFISIGKSGVQLMNGIIVADFTNLQWRSFFLAFCTVPFLVTTWVSGYIVENIVASNWKWGYGMFAIITPATLIPAIVIMYWLDHKAAKEGKVPFGAEPFNAKQREIANMGLSPLKTKLLLIKEALLEIDAIGLILLGFAFSLILLPFSLYSYAENGFRNPSMIAMIVVGGILLIVHIVYEVKFAKYSLLPKRVLFNRTFICCVFIDFLYMFGGYMPLLYFTSYTMATLNLSIRDWTYLSNTTTMGLCFFGVIWGLLFRIYHRYKVFQVVGIAIKLIGMGLYVRCASTSTPPSLGNVVAGLIITVLGDAASAMGTQVAAQAAVPHQDLAATISVLSLYSSIGAAIGSAITSVIWTSKLPNAMYKYVPDITKAATFYGAVLSIAAEPWGSPDRLGAIKAYQEVNYILFSAGLGVSSLMFVVSLFQTNFYLGRQRNCYEKDENEDIQKDNEKNEAFGLFDWVKKPFN